VVILTHSKLRLPRIFSIKIIFQVLLPIQELKPIQEQVVNLVECEMKSLIEDTKKPNVELNRNLDKLNGVQQDCLSMLVDMKRFD